MSEHDLFTLPIDEITHDVVDEFCKLGRKEDIDLDYKSDWPNDLDRILCAFANTQGGVVLVGVEELGKTRCPKTPLLGVTGSEAALRQKVQNIAFDRIYPPVLPEVQVCGSPHSPDRSVVVIRITPTRRMHSVDRRRRIYIRAADNNRDYELASISDLEWLWSERAKDEILKDELLRKAEVRSDSDTIGWENNSAKQCWFDSPRLVVTSMPSFPSLVPGINLFEFMNIVKNVRDVRSEWEWIDIAFPPQKRPFRSVVGGVSSTHRGIGHYQEYIELEHHGLCYYALSLRLEDVTKRKDKEAGQHQYFLAYAVIEFLDLVLRYFRLVYGASSFHWPVMLNAVIRNTKGIRLNYRKPMTNHIWEEPISHHICTDEEVLLFSHETSALAIESEKMRLLYQASEAMFWAFGLSTQDTNPREWLANLASTKD